MSVQLYRGQSDPCNLCNPPFANCLYLGAGSDFNCGKSGRQMAGFPYRLRAEVLMFVQFHYQLRAGKLYITSCIDSYVFCRTLFIINNMLNSIFSWIPDNQLCPQAKWTNNNNYCLESLPILEGLAMAAREVRRAEKPDNWRWRTIKVVFIVKGQCRLRVRGDK